MCFKIKVIIETSARHVHLSKEALENLFGEGYNLTVKRWLSQPGQFVSTEKVDIVSEKDTIKNVSVLGPLRDKTQVELSITDCIKMRINPNIRESGDIVNTPGCKIIGPHGEYIISEGVIVAKRHIHIDPDTAYKLGLCDKQIVSVSVNTEYRSGIFNDVVIRVDPKYSLAMHIDTDEANAFGINKSCYGNIL